MQKLDCYENALVAQLGMRRRTSCSVRQEQRANRRRINHIVSMTLVLERLASRAGLTMTSCLLSQAAEKARTTSTELQEAESH
jgi:hypothetical protein